jgi:hypothetical protein
MSDASEKMLKVQAEVMVKASEIQTLLEMFEGSLVRIATDRLVNCNYSLKGKVLEIHKAEWRDSIGLVFWMVGFHNTYMAREVEFV